MAPIWSWIGAILALPLALASHGDSIPKNYIVEFSDSYTSTDTFISILARNGISASLNRDLSFSLFQGCSFRLLDDTRDDTAIIKKISLMSIVKNISPVRTLQAPQRQLLSTGDASSNHQHNSKIRRADSKDSYYPHLMTGVDKLRREGYTGSGIRVAVIDSGIDYKHPALGGCFGKGCLVEFGYNFLNSSDTPYDDCNGHGTHVSGLIAAQPGSRYNLTGVAPNVTLGHYKLLTCAGQPSSVMTSETFTDVIVDAFRMAYEDKADIISASLGTYSGWAEEPWGQLIAKLADAGVPSLVAVGNNGNAGMFFSSDGVDNPAAIGVGSFNNLYAPMLLAEGTYSANNTTKTFGWEISGESDFVNGTYQLYPLSINSSIVNDGCETLPADTVDLSDKIVLIRRGGCSLQQKQDNVAKAGAKNILVYNNRPGVDVLTYNTPGLVGIGMVFAGTGEEWVKLAASNTNITLRMVSKKYAGTIYLAEINKQAGGQVSHFTQFGPSNQLLPVTVALSPGYFMLSTYPLALGGYAVMSGTSMATPFLAGCIALMMEARGKLPVAEIKARFAAAASPNVFHDGISGSPFLASVAQQGAGLIDAYKAVHAATILNVSSIAFNDTEHLAPGWIRINNTGLETIIYTIGHVGAATLYTLPDDGTTIPQTTGIGEFMERNTEYASLQFSTRLLLLAPGRSAVLKVTATPPQGLNATRIPIYSGYITLNGTSGDSLSIPYLGAASSMRNATILDTNHGANYLLSSATVERVKANDIFILPQPNTTAAAVNTSHPIFLINLSMGTALLSVGVKSDNNTIIGEVDGYPKQYNSRNFALSGGPQPIRWRGELADGTYVPAGYYSLVVRALKIFGNPKISTDYEVVETPRFRIKYDAGNRR